MLNFRGVNVVLLVLKPTTPWVESDAIMVNSHHQEEAEQRRQAAWTHAKGRSGRGLSVATCFWVGQYYSLIRFSTSV